MFLFQRFPSPDLFGFKCFLFIRYKCITIFCLLAGVLIVTTPQDVALIDARRGVAMFSKVEVPV